MQKKIAAINDLSGIGKCSLTVAIPILSALKIQCCPFPTAILSSQTGYPEFTFLDFTSEMPKYSDTWKKLNQKFDAIYSGFLGSHEQIDIVIDFIEKNSPSLVIVDPVMGDDGKIYPVFSDEIIREIRELVKHSNITTPNITEACLLTQRDYRKHDFSRDELKEIAKDISGMGPEYVVITGIHEPGKKITNLAYDRKNDICTFITKDYMKCSYSGTGDIFASVLSGLMTIGHDFIFSVKTAVDFVSESISYTSKFDIDRNDGVMFELFLDRLTSIDHISSDKL